MKKLLSRILVLLIILGCFCSCKTYNGTEFNAVMIGGYKDYFSVTTLDSNVDFYDANISVNVSELGFKIKQGDVVKIKIQYRDLDEFGVVKITPESVELLEHQVQTITPQEAENIKNDALFVDARSQDEYNMGHIENAVCLTYKTLEKNYEKLLVNKEQKIIVYAGSEETASLTASHLIAFGYKNVYCLGNINDYKYDLVA